MSTSASASNAKTCAMDYYQSANLFENFFMRKMFVLLKQCCKIKSKKLVTT